jgi:hypothetical protein
MSGLTALATSALEFAVPLALVTYCEAGFQVIAHDTAFVARFAIGAAST